jgi:hypothetical protein
MNIVNSQQTPMAMLTVNTTVDSQQTPVLTMNIVNSQQTPVLTVNITVDSQQKTSAYSEYNSG